MSFAPCAICHKPLPPIPFGPANASCCWDCWEGAGESYAIVREHAQGPSIGDVVEVWDDGIDEPDWAPALVVSVNTEARTFRVEVCDERWTCRFGESWGYVPAVGPDDPQITTRAQLLEVLG